MLRCLKNKCQQIFKSAKYREINFPESWNLSPLSRKLANIIANINTRGENLLIIKFAALLRWPERVLNNIFQYVKLFITLQFAKVNPKIMSFTRMLFRERLPNNRNSCCTAVVATCIRKSMEHLE